MGAVQEQRILTPNRPLGGAPISQRGTQAQSAAEPGQQRHLAADPQSAAPGASASHGNAALPGGTWKPRAEQMPAPAADRPERILQKLWDRIFVKDFKFDRFHYFFMILYH